MSKEDREAMLDRAHPALSIRRQCRLLHLARSGVYRARAANDDEDMALLRRLANHVHRHQRLGPSVLISAGWYYTKPR